MATLLKALSSFLSHCNELIQSYELTFYLLNMATQIFIGHLNAFISPEHETSLYDKTHTHFA